MSQHRSVCDEVLIAMRRIIRAIDLHSRSLTQRYGLTGPQLILLKELGATEQKSVGELAKKVSLSSATVTNILDRLEKRELIERVRSSADRRRMMVRATDEGARVIAKAPALLQDHFVQKFERLHDWEQTLLLSSLQRIAALMEIKDDDSPPLLVSGPIVAPAEETANNL